MADTDRPGGDRTGASSDARGSRPLRVYRGDRPRAPTASVAVGERLAALERRVEEALAAGGPRRDAEAALRLREVLDGALASMAAARRGRPTDLLGALADREPLEALLGALYRYWWRVEAIGIERVPAQGRVVLAANRGGALVPWEAFMIRAALATAHPARRDARVVVDDWLGRAPFVGPALTRLGAVHTPQAVRRLLAIETAVIAFPEGAGAVAKRFRERYRLARFGRSMPVRLAVGAGAPIVPVAVIGAEEAQPVLARFDLAGRLAGLPTLPVTPTFPLLGLVGLVPLPTKWLLLFGEPLVVADAGAPKAAATAGRVSEQLRERLQALVLEGLRRRRSVFRG